MDLIKFLVEVFAIICLIGLISILIFCIYSIWIYIFNPPPDTIIYTTINTNTLKDCFTNNIKVNCT